jgi:hypothetical protein
MHIRKLLVPKHLEIGSLSRRKRMMRSKLQLEHANISIQRNMMKRLEPMREIETIMRHFDEYLAYNLEGFRNVDRDNTLKELVPSIEELQAWLIKILIASILRAKYGG